MQGVTESEAVRRAHDIKRGCSTCFHFKVCGMAHAFAPIIANSFPDTADSPRTTPIEPDRLAEICGAYIPILGTLTA